MVYQRILGWLVILVYQMGWPEACGSLYILKESFTLVMDVLGVETRKKIVNIK